MSSVNDYGTVAGETLADPALGGENGWAAAMARVVNNSDTTVDARIAAMQASLATAIASAVPTGTIVAFAGSAAPSGWHLCDGSAHGNGKLATVIGSPNTPDLRDRFVVGAGGAYPKGATGGAATVTLTEAESGLRNHGHGASAGTVSSDHTHSGQTGGHSVDHAHYVSLGDGGHSHNSSYGNNYQGSNIEQNPPGTTYSPIGNTDDRFGALFSAGNHGHAGWTGGVNTDHSHAFTTGGISANHTHTVTVNNSGGAPATAAHENRPPYWALTYIVKG